MQAERQRTHELSAVRTSKISPLSGQTQRQALFSERVLSLQRLAGNAAVAELIRADHGPAGDGVDVQRYEAGEHAQFGAKEGQAEEIFDIGGVKVSYGEMIAMGDFYESIDQVRRAPKEELQQLVNLIRRDKKAFMGVPGYTPVTNEEWQKATEGRKHKAWRPDEYLDLAAKNESHFARLNREKWLSNHLQAVHLAQKGKLDLALATNAFGDHFLTDAFSAGHLIEKKKMTDDARANLKKVDPAVFARQVADALLDHPAARAKLSLYQISPSPWSRDWLEVDRTSMGRVVEFIRNNDDSKYFSMFARAVHDKLNRSKRYGKGVLVKNSYGTQWYLSGDETLNLSSDTLAVGQAAVEQSKANVNGSYKQKTVNYSELVTKVWNYTPVPVDEGAAFVADAEKTLTDPSNPETAPAIAQIAVDNLDMMIEELTTYHMCRRVAGRTVPAPQLGDFEVPNLAARPA